MNLSASDLRRMQDDAEVIARQFGLDFFPTIFEVVDFKVMNQLAALGGFPVRWPHWRWGMEYYRLAKSFGYGLHRIYEMVINTDPSYAYLMASNEPVVQKLVMYHVFAHVHFFKNNLWFANTNRNMLDEMAAHATRISRYTERFGQDEVEKFIDHCLSLENLVDMHSLGVQRRAEEDHSKRPEPERLEVGREYMDHFVNPPEELSRRRQELEEKQKKARKRFPSQPERDVLLFLLEHAPLESWQQDILGIIREEMYYFVPQAQTKIINEGFAAWTHSKMMTGPAATADEIITFAESHAGTVAAHRGSINPYRLGMYLLRDIEDRWNRGAFGKEYDDCTDLRVKQEWDSKLGLGKQKVFEVVRSKNDIGLIDEFLTPEFAHEHRLFTYDYQPYGDVYYISGRDFDLIKQRWLLRLTNWGQPTVWVWDANFENRGELRLEHRFRGINLDKAWIQETLEALLALWERPVHIGTMEFHYDALGHPVSLERKLYSNYGINRQDLVLEEIPREKWGQYTEGGYRL